MKKWMEKELKRRENDCWKDLFLKIKRRSAMIRRVKESGGSGDAVWMTLQIHNATEHD